MREPTDEFDALLAPPAAASGAPGSRGIASAGAALPAAPGSARPAAALELVDAADRPGLRDFADHLGLYRDPLLAGSFAGLVLGLAGVFVVLRRAVFLTAAVSQSGALGVACAFLIGIHTGITPPPGLFAFVFAAGGALVLAFGNPGRLPREAVVGVVYLAAGSLAVIVGARISQEAHDVASLLFGSAVLVRPRDLWSIVGVGAAATALLLALARALEFTGFDPDAARVQGLPVRRIEALLWLVVSAEVAVTTRALGALPVFALAVLPAFGALGLARRLPACLALAATFGAASGCLGYVAAFLLDLPVGASQAAVAALIALGAAIAPRCRRVGRWAKPA